MPPLILALLPLVLQEGAHQAEHEASRRFIKITARDGRRGSISVDGTFMIEVHHCTHPASTCRPLKPPLLIHPTTHRF